MKKILLLILLCFTLAAIFLTGCNTIPPKPDIDRIKSDLIGRTVDSPDYPISWQFKDLSEFEEVTIYGEHMENNVIEYYLILKLRDMDTNEKYLAEIFFLYKIGKNGWEVFDLYPISLQIDTSTN
jgi:hypothetical protein